MLLDLICLTSVNLTRSRATDTSAKLMPAMDDQPQVRFQVETIWPAAGLDDRSRQWSMVL
jgi:hypothetical protein